ncbi:MAG: endonuclease/exonuclease/phosphatase family protein [Chloroflexota bacterium]
MRIVSWNPGAAYGPYVGRHDEAWRYLESLEPDIALLQECVPAAWALRRWTVVKPAFSFWTTAVAVPARPTTEVAIPKGNLLARFRGFAAAAEVTVPGIGPVVAVSVHASAHPANARTLRGLDPAALRRPSATEPWWNDLFFAGAVELVAGRRFIVGGDWNTARYVDAHGIPTPVGADSFARAAEAGWLDLHQAAVGAEERTWYGRRNPRAYVPDHVFADPETAMLLASATVDPAPAEGKLSDHAPVLVNMDLPAASEDEVEGRAAADAVPPELARRPPTVRLEVIG